MLKRIVLLPLILVASLVSAQHLEWRSTNGPIAGTFYCAIVADNGYYYVGGTTGIYRSTDGGEYWSERLRTDFDPLTRMLYEHPMSHALFGDGPDYAVARSLDKGATWRSINLFTSGYGRFVSGTHGRIFALGDGLKYSDDTGRTWRTVIDTSLTLWAITSIIPVDQQHLVASNNRAGKAGIYESTDAGLTWKQTHFTGRYGPDEMLRTKRGTFIARTLNGLLRFALDKLGDTTLAIPLRSVLCLAQDSTGAILAGRYASGVWRSTDEGQTWDSIGLPHRIINDIAVTPAGTYIAACDSGIWIREAASTEWHIHAQGTSDRKIVEFFVTRSGLPIVSSLGDGLDFLLSLDGPWRHNDSLPWIERMFADRDGVVYGQRDGLGYLRSFDNGASWLLQPSGMQAQTVGSTYDNRIFNEYYDSLWISADKAVTWTKYVLRQKDAYRVRVLTDSIWLWMGSGAIERSIDHGNHWDVVLRREAFVQTDFAGDEPLLFAAADTILYRSTDLGESWLSDTLSFTPNVLTYAGSGVLFASSYHDGIFLSRDAGQTWSMEMAGIKDTLTASIFVGGGRAFVYTGGGVYYSTPLSAATVRNGVERKNFRLDIYPNPASSQITVMINALNENAPKESPLVIDLFDEAGQVIRSIDASDGKIATVDVSLLTPGCYYLRASLGELTQVRPLVIR